MPSSYTTSLRLTLPATGELSGQWGNTVNTGITELLDAAVAGTASISTWGGAGVAYTLSNNSGTADEARKMFIVATGSPGEAKNVICPAVSKFYVFRNDTTGGFALTLKTSGGTGIAVPAGQYKFLYCDGTNVVEMFNSAGALTLSGALSVGGTTTLASNPMLSAGTANGVLYLNGSKVATSGSALVFDGTRLLVQTTSSNISSSERLTVNGLATTSTSSTTVPAIYAQNSDTTASTNQPYIYLHDGVASRAGLGANYTDSALVLNGFGGIYFRYGGNGMGTTEGMRLTSTGLGIGTSSPSVKLHVASSGSEQLRVEGTTATGYTSMNLYGTGRRYAVGVGNASETALGLANNFYIYDSTVGVTRVVLDTSGNLGLGVTPSAWSASYKAISVGYAGGQQMASGTGNSQALWTTNLVFTGTGATGWKLPNNVAGTAYEQYLGVHKWYNAPANGVNGDATLTQAMTLDASGNLGVGTTSPDVFSRGYGRVLGVSSASSAGIEVNAATGNTATFDLGVNGTRYAYFNATASDSFLSTAAANPLLLGTNNTERARITSGGDLLVGTTSVPSPFTTPAITAYRSGSSHSLVATGNSAGFDPIVSWNRATAGDNAFVAFGTEGTWTSRGTIDYNRAGGLVRYNTTSDYRAKDIIGPITNSGEVIDSLKVYEGVMKGATQSRPMLIAHEAQAHAPYAVSGVKDEVNEDGTPKFQQIDVSSLVPLLLAEIQSLRARVAALEAQP